MRVFFVSMLVLSTCCSFTSPQKSHAIASTPKPSTTFAVNVFKANTKQPIAKYDVLMEGAKLPSPNGFFCEIEGSHTSKEDVSGGIRCIVSSGVGYVFGASSEVSCRRNVPDTHTSSFTLFGVSRTHKAALYTYNVSCVTK